MLLSVLAFLAGLASVTAARTQCAPPAVCSQPAASFSRLQWVHPRVQWNFNGGFCGAFSLQTLMMTHGAWVSEDLVRKANIGAPCFGHGNGPNSTICASANSSQCISSEPGGCEVAPENYDWTCEGLRLNCDIWDYNRPRPQAAAYKSWLKAHLVNGTPVVWVPMLKGASNTPYGPRSCPGGGHFNHHEPVLGIGSNRSLSDPTVYNEDWLVHLSDEDEAGELVTYYRRFSSLEDSPSLHGNCKRSDPQRSCAYPCFDEQVTYGIAVKGFARDEVDDLPVSIDVDTDEEPDSREGQRPVLLHANVTIRALQRDHHYELYRFNGINQFPSSGVGGFASKVPFTATDQVWKYQDPTPFLSDGAVYYIARRASVANADAVWPHPLAARLTSTLPTLPFETATQFRAQFREHSASPLCTDPACTYYNGTRALDAKGQRRHDTGTATFDGSTAFYQDALWLCEGTSSNSTPVQITWTNTSSPQCSATAPKMGFCNNPGPELIVPAGASYIGLEQGVNGVAAHHWSFFYPVFQGEAEAWTAAEPELNNALIRFTGARVTTDYWDVVTGTPGDEFFQPAPQCKYT